MTALYRHFDAEGRLLYVGISRSVTARLAQHADSPWDDLIARIDVERFTTRAHAEAAEFVAIQTEGPIHNRTYNGRGAPAEVPPGDYSLPEYLAAAGMSQTQFAALIPTSQANVCRWCKGSAFPNHKHMGRIKKLTGDRVFDVWFRRFRERRAAA